METAEGFIPPEGPGTPHADLYALGKLLYELDASRDRMDFPQLPAGINKLPDREVITRACVPEPRHRYDTATELQAELNLFLAGRSPTSNFTRRRVRTQNFVAYETKFCREATVAIVSATHVLSSFYDSDGGSEWVCLDAPEYVWH